jgi:hypothetical protein
MEFAKTVMPSLQTLQRVRLAIIINPRNEDQLTGLCDQLEEIS